MKRIIKLIALPCILLGFISCEDEDKARITPYADETQGAFLRTIDAGGVINRTDIAGSSYSITGELVAASNDDVSNVEIMVEFVDRTTDDDPGTNDDESIDPVLVASADVSTFVSNSNGLPETTFDIGISDATTALGLDLGDIEGGDQFLFWVVINMQDGTKFEKGNSGDSVTGELFFSSPMVYTGSVVCILPMPPAGDWIIEMVDSYGDGWDGAFITATINGTGTDYTATDFGTNHTVNVPQGSSSLIFTYTPGNFESEHSFTIKAPSGNIVSEQGPGPTAGEITLNLCNE
ncbi:hypothetical protein [Maribacter sp. HTCC2170]|uniref:hypothetical protein n=1 Tax=Maribacter sp. (strain HTCC2170 / KCCM 42371) TaxID=313603 RepID=UPI00006BE0C1|nr:hypothetical protein [Maribacter sp. HTCC2170]EAQ99960.1 hypothetical protein FB2170_01262 [Maribacter sp. HTCC2170]